MSAASLSSPFAYEQHTDHVLREHVQATLPAGVELEANRIVDGSDKSGWNRAAASSARRHHRLAVGRGEDSACEPLEGLP